MLEFSDPLGLEEPTRPIPPRVLAMTASLAVIALILTLLSARTGVGRVPVAEAADPAAQTIEIAFVERIDGAIDVLRTSDAAVLVHLEDGEGGFLRGILRPLRRERTRFDEDAGAPYVLTRHESGALTLSDASTDLVVDIAAFGASSVEHFGALFTAAEALR